MNILEFIRKNSALVLIVIAGVGLGLLMMDYGNKSSMISGDYYIQVDGTSYNDMEAINSLGGNGVSYLQEISSAVPRKLRAQFDANGNEQLEEDELTNMQEWMAEQPQLQESMSELDSVLQAWTYGHTRDAKTNVAVNRAIIQAEAKRLGIYPNKEQIDSFIKSLPAFQNVDGSFDQDLYRRLAGYRKDVADNATETAFRSVVADLIVWLSLEKLITRDMSLQAQTQNALINTQIQDMFVKTAWLDAANIPTVEPSDEESKDYWEKHKDNYLSDERRVVTLYTLTPDKDSSVDELLTTAELLMQDIAQSQQADIATMLAEAAENPENAPFTYKTADGQAGITLSAFTKATAPSELTTQIEGKDGLIPLSDMAFEVESAPSMADYDAALSAGKALPATGIKQLRGFYPTQDGKLVMIQVQAIEKPSVLSYEDAKSAADADFTKDAHLAALTSKANEVQTQMTEAADLEAAFALATQEGLSVEDLGPISLETNFDLAQGITPSSLLTTASGKFAPLYVSADGARMTALTSRSYTDSPDMAAFKTLRLLPMANEKLKQQLLIDWLHMCYQKYDVKLAERAVSSK